MLAKDSLVARERRIPCLGDFGLESLKPRSPGRRFPALLLSNAGVEVYHAAKKGERSITPRARLV